MLDELIKKASAKVETLSGPKSIGLSRAIKKWTRITEQLENHMMKTASTKSQPFNALAKKRRMDIALTVNNIQQRKRRRLIDTMKTNASVIKDCYKLDTALISLMKRHAMGVSIDEMILDQLLCAVTKEDESKSYAFLHIGSSLIEHPSAIDALLKALFIPSGRMKSLNIKIKCAKLVAIAVFAAEKKLITLFEEEEREKDFIKSMLSQGLDGIEVTANVSNNNIRNTNAYYSSFLSPHFILFAFAWNHIR